MDEPFDFDEFEFENEPSKERKVKFRGVEFHLTSEQTAILEELIDKRGWREPKAIKAILDEFQIKYPEWYESKNGFELVPILRGFTEIQTLYNIVTPVGGTICGGYVRYMCSPTRDPHPASDIDVYCRNMDTFERIVQILESEPYNLSSKHENEVSKTYHSMTEGAFIACPTIQLIKPIVEGAIMVQGSVRDILSNFDFTVIRGAVVTRELALVDADYLHDEAVRVLRIKNIHCPISSTLRFCKYAKKGYWSPPMQIVKLFQDWDNRSKEYKDKIIKYLEQTEQQEGLTEKEINELEGLMRID